MGLDLVEMVIQVEDTFGFSIPNEDIEHILIMGKLYDYVLAHRFHGKQDACLSSMTFYKVRRALMSVLQVERKEVRVSTELSALMSKQRRKTWQAIEKLTGFRLPPLRRPRRVVMISALAVIGLGIAVPAMLGLRPFGGGVAAALASMCIFAFVFYQITESLAYMFPPDVETVGQLTKGILARNYQPIVAEAQKSSTDEEVWDILRRIVGEQFAVPIERLTKETNFVQDLHID
jgi:acyl carrier protein